MYVCMCVRIYIYIYTYTYTHIHTHTYHLGAIIFSLFMYSSFMILWGMVAHYKYLAGEHYPDGLALVILLLIIVLIIYVCYLLIR